MVVLETISPSMPVRRATAAMSAFSSSVRSGAILMSSGTRFPLTSVFGFGGLVGGDRKAIDSPI